MVPKISYESPFVKVVAMVSVTAVKSEYRIIIGKFSLLKNFVGVINHENLKHEIKFTLGKFSHVRV